MSTSAPTVDAPDKLVSPISMEPAPNYVGVPAAFSLGLATIYDGRVLDVRFPFTNVEQNFGSAALFWNALQLSQSTVAGELDLDSLTMVMDFFDDLFEGDKKGISFYKKHANVDAVGKLIDTLLLDEHPLAAFGYRHGVVLAWCQNFATGPADRLDAWLRLTLLSERKKQPNSMNLDGIFGKLEKLIWTDFGPVDASTSAWDLFRMGVTPDGDIDKFPLMIKYVIPSGVRLAIGADVRLGAHLAEGTVVMYGGGANFNSGTLDRRSNAKKRKLKNVGCMIEGVIAQGIAVGDGTQFGRYSGVIGTLTGKSKVKNGVGEGCLLGALSELGIPVGDNVGLESGLALMAGTKVTVINLDKSEVPGVYARDLAGESNLQYLRNSANGRVEARRLPRGKTVVEATAELHAA